jgi:hypothetical protein
MAPDAAAAAAGRKLARPEAWSSLGQSERAFFGECRGSALYRTQISALDLTARCTCPSRKFPCKHALGLLFLIAEAPAVFPAPGSEPEWVTSAREKRAAAEQRRRSRAGGKPVDTAAQAKRASARQSNVLAGIEQLEIWMCDLVRRGLGRLPSDGPDLWDAQARRLVDAQAPGLASRVRRIGGRVGVGDDWSERVLGDLGQLALLSRAYRRLEALPEGLQHEVRRLIGFTLDKDDVLALGESVDDEWVVASSRVTEDERLRIQRTWLVGVASARTALVLQVAAGTTPFQEVFVGGSAFGARITFWPGTRAERGLIAERRSAIEGSRVPPHGRSIAAALEDYATGVAQSPWLERTLVLLEGVAIARTPSGAWYAVDQERRALRLRGQRHEVLWALSGGRPLLLVAEWNGFVLDPLAAYREGLGVALHDEVP